MTSRVVDGSSREAEVPPAQPLSVLTVVRSGIGLTTDLYDLMVINCVRPELEACHGTMSNAMNGAITSATTAGAMVGQLAFGFLADRIGRRKTFIATSVLLCVSAAGSAMSQRVGGLHLYQVLMIWRFLLGIGVGGEYPLSSAVTAEEATVGKSARSMALTYMMFCIGGLLGPIVVLCFLYAGVSAELTWRLSMAGGAVLAVTGTVLRVGTMKESRAWLETRAASKTGSQGMFCSLHTLRSLWRPLLGTTSTYFLYDVVGWGFGGYTSTIFQSSTRIGTLWYVLLMYVMTIPGFFLTLWMGHFGRRAYQIVGFLGMSCCFFTVGLLYGHAPEIVLVFIYGIQKMFDSFGPGCTTFVIPGEIFPSQVRATCHGISSAAGKLGAFVGISMFPSVAAAIGPQASFFVGGVILIVGALLTCVLTPPYTEETLRRVRDATKDDISRTTEVLWAKCNDESACSVMPTNQQYLLTKQHNYAI